MKAKIIIEPEDFEPIRLASIKLGTVKVKKLNDLAIEVEYMEPYSLFNLGRMTSVVKLRPKS